MNDGYCGGSAFPVEKRGLSEGMTLRDYFADKVMAVLADQYEVARYEKEITSVARDAYLIADAMLKERAK